MTRSKIDVAYGRPRKGSRDRCRNSPPSSGRDIAAFGLEGFSGFSPTLANPAREADPYDELIFTPEGRGMQRRGNGNNKVDTSIWAKRAKMALVPWQLNDEGARTKDVVQLTFNEASVTSMGGRYYVLEAGNYVMLVEGPRHGFTPESGRSTICAVSTAIDDICDNVSTDAPLDQFPSIDEDEPAEIRLISE